MCDIFGTQAAANASNAQTALINQEQAQQQQNVQQGTHAINEAFRQFTPDYFNNAKQSYINAYDPALTDQYNIAQDQLTSGLADRDMLDSTVGANAFGQLEKQYNSTQADIGNSATDFANNLQAQEQQAKAQVQALNTGAASPFAIGTQAQAAGATVQAPSTFPSLANVFGSTLQPFSAAAKTNQASLSPISSTGIPFTTAPSQPSSTIG